MWWALSWIMDYRFTSKGATFNEIGERLSQFFYVTPAGANAPHGQLLAAGMLAWAGLLLAFSLWVVGPLLSLAL